MMKSQTKTASGALAGVRRRQRLLARGAFVRPIIGRMALGATLALLTGLALKTAPAGAIVYVMPTDESMVDRSPIIVFGEVLSAQPGSDPDSPTTEYLFAVEEVLKGFVAGSGILVRQPGGLTADGRYMRVMGLPMLAAGDRMLLFLRPDEQGAHIIVEYALGMFFEARLGDRSFLLRDASLQGAAVLPNGRAAPDGDRDQGHRDGVAFRRWIADRAADADTPSDYFVQELPERPTPAASPVRLTPVGCAAETLPARWRNFDRGESVGFEVQSGGQPGMDGGGLAQVRAAMRVWNADPGSNVNLHFARTIDLASRLREANGGNSITFEDPRDEIEGTFVLGEGGVLALTSVRTTCGTSHSVGGQPARPAREITQTNLVTQDGFESYLRNLDSGTAQRVFLDVMAHELGHALGIDHSANPTGAATARSTGTGALTQPIGDRDMELHAALNTEERNAVRSLYPETNASQDSYCRANSVVDPGNRCDIYNTSFYFEVQSNGTGCLRAGGITSCSGRSQNWRNSTLNGVRITFVASRNSDDSWTISEVDPSPPGGGGSSSPDLVVSSASVDDSSPTAGQSLTLRATVRNQGHGRSNSTTLRYYRSSDSRISSSDTQVGTDSVAALSASATSAESISLSAPSSPGTYYYGACVDSVSGESVTTNNCSTSARLTVRGSDPDLIVEAPRSTESSVAPRGTFRFGATVRNQGDSRSSATTLRYYRSTDSTITTSDTQVGTDPIGALSSSGTDRQSIGQRAPATDGVYYYGACVDLVAGESNRTNNCSMGVRVTVGSGGGSTSGADLVVESPRSTESAVPLGGTFRFGATVRNQGESTSSATTLRYYRSTDSTITTSDTQVGTDPIGVLAASDTDRQSVGQRAPSTDGTYYYGACVDPVVGESDTTNNCSSGVRVTVGDGGGDEVGSGFDLVRDNRFATGITYAHGRFYVVDWFDRKVYAYHASDGRRDAAADFDLDRDNRLATGITYTQDRFYVVDEGTDKVYAYRASNGRHDAAANFDLAPESINAEGITYAEGRFYVLAEGTGPKVFAYRASDGRHDAAADFDLAISLYATGITYAEGRFYVLAGRRVFAYRASDGRHDTSADFDLATYATGITYVGGKLFIVDGVSVYAYPVGGADGSPGADLVVESPRSTESSVEPRGAFRFGATVRNQGEGSSEATTLRYYRSADATITTSDTQVGTDSIAALSTSDTDRQSIGLRAPSSDGTYYYGACVDPVSGESDTTNNCSTGVRVTVGDGGGGASGADLVVESPRSTESSVAPGGTFRFGATVRNQGTGPSGVTTLRYYRSSDSRITTSDTPVGTDAIGALSASDTDRQSIGQRAPATPGIYYYGGCVDSVAGESDTGNNCSGAVSVTVGGGGTSAPDLFVSDVYFNDNDEFQMTVGNQGDATAASTVSRLYRSSNSTIDNSDTQVATVRLEAIPAGVSIGYAVTLGDTAWPSSPGTYYYGACVDSVPDESNTGNNCSSGVRVTVGDGGSSAPDLVVSSASVSNSNPGAGGRFTLRATVRNQGDARSSSTLLRYYRSSNSTIDSSDTLVDTDVVGALSASASNAESANLTAPSSAGTYYYGACVDAVSGESNTSNNCSSAVRLTVSGGSDDGACRAGLVVNPGETCTYKGYTFRVDSSGTARIAFFQSTNRISNTGTVNGVRWNFDARRNTGSNSWTIHVAD